jgi:GH43 family beta-xylosidase
LVSDVKGGAQTEMFENRVLRKIVGLKRDEVMEVWRKRHRKELCDLYSSPNIIRIIK